MNHDGGSPGRRPVPSRRGLHGAVDAGNLRPRVSDRPGFIKVAIRAEIYVMNYLLLKNSFLSS